MAISSSSENQQMVKLLSANGDILEASSRVLSVSSRFLADKIAGMGPGQSQPIQLDIVTSTLKRVIDFCEKHKEDHPSVAERHRERPKKFSIPRWDKQLLNQLDRSNLFDLVNAAHLLQMDVLINYACKTVADMARGKTSEELRVLFGIPETWEQPSTSTYNWD